MIRQSVQKETETKGNFTLERKKHTFTYRFTSVWLFAEGIPEIEQHVCQPILKERAIVPWLEVSEFEAPNQLEIKGENPGKDFQLRKPPTLCLNFSQIPG